MIIKTSIRLFLAFLVILLLTTIFYSAIQILPDLSRPEDELLDFPISEFEQPYDVTIGIHITERGEYPNFVQAKISSDFVRQIHSNNICLDKLFIMAHDIVPISVSYTIDEIHTDRFSYSINTCDSAGDSGTGDLAAVNFNVITPSSLYPFDNSELRLDLWFEGHTKEDPSKTFRIIPYVTVLSDIPNWNNHITTNQGNTSASVYVDISRPTGYKILFVILSTILLGTLLALFFTQEANHFWGIIITVALGLGGIHDLLVQPFVTWTNLVDSMIVALYLFIFLIILIKTIFFPIWQWSESINKTPVRDKRKKISKTRNNRNL